VKVTFLHSLDFLFLQDHRSLDYVNLIVFIQVHKLLLLNIVSALNAADPSIALIILFLLRH